MIRQDAPNCLYLLHFDEPIRRARHYLGICRSDRLEKRMREHQGGYGARLTSRLVNHGLGFALARVIANASRDDERRLKRAGHFDRLCPICSGNLDATAIISDFPHYPAPVVKPRDALAGWGPAGPMFPSRMKTDRQTS